jgi:hypothetical protein
MNTMRNRFSSIQKTTVAEVSMAQRFLTRRCLCVLTFSAGIAFRAGKPVAPDSKREDMFRRDQIERAGSRWMVSAAGLVFLLGAAFAAHAGTDFAVATRCEWLPRNRRK